MPNVALGHLEQVDPREAWVDEAQEFTPWLAQENNLALLAETIGIDLELEAQEQKVGPFRADVLCKDTINDQWVLIENQLSKTNHNHLGQLLTYAAGLKAETIIWIANRFTEEHRAALDWLNEITDNRFNFFGLEIELWRIANSPVAPKFNIVAQPNDWARTMAQQAAKIEDTGLSEFRQLQLEFWTGFREHLKEEKTQIKPGKPRPRQSMAIATGRTGFRLRAIASFFNTESNSFEKDELRAELVLLKAAGARVYSYLQNEKQAIEEEFGEKLTWDNRDEVNYSRIYVRADANLQDKEQWCNYYQWLCERIDGLYHIFSGRIKNVLPSAGPADTEDENESDSSLN